VFTCRTDEGGSCSSLAEALTDLILYRLLVLRLGAVLRYFIRLDALAKALSVIATATWLGGWLGVCHTPVLYQNG